MAITYDSTTNIREHIMLQRSTLSVMEQLLMANSKTELLVVYTDLIAALTADKDIVTAADNCDTLIQ